MPTLWRGLGYAVPTSHVLRALSVSQFFCLGPGCPTLSVLTEAGPVLMTQFELVEQRLGRSFSSRWQWGEVGWVALAFLVVTAVAAAALQVRSWK
jgi:hypothetical protein